VSLSTNATSARRRPKWTTGGEVGLTAAPGAATLGRHMGRPRLAVIALLASAACLAACASQSTPSTSSSLSSLSSPSSSSSPTQEVTLPRQASTPPAIAPGSSASADLMTVNVTNPQPLLVQLPVVETASIVNPGPAPTRLAVEMAIGTKRAGIGTTGFGNTTVERWFAPSASWAQVTLSVDPSGVMQGSFPWDIPAGASSLRLRITIGPGFYPQQDGNQAPLAITLAGPAGVVGQQRLTLPVLAPTVAVVSQPTTMPRSGQAEFDFVIQNSTGATYPTFAAELNMVCQTPTLVCNAGGGWMLAGFTVDWSDGAGWQPLAVGPTPNVLMFVESSPLPPGSQQVRIQLSFGPDLDPRATSTSLQLFVGPTDGSFNDIAWAKASSVTITP
jgi:hypothetical protein